MADRTTIRSRKAYNKTVKSERSRRESNRMEKKRNCFSTCTRYSIKQIVELYDSDYVNDGDTVVHQRI